MASKKNKKKTSNAAASTSASVDIDDRTPKELKAKAKLAKKPSNLNAAQVKEAEVSESQTTPQSQARNKEKKAKDGNRGKNHDDRDAKKFKNINNRNKEKGSTSKMSVDVEKKDGHTEKSIGGVIFMCNAKTKADCFSYSVMGVSANKKDFIMGIKPGLKLFLFDFDLKLMYGIYEASSAGGMKLEPAAFGGAFPAQVRFTIEKDCLPLPENVFKIAIKDTYDERRHKFKTELTFKQVERLRQLFKPAPWLHPTSSVSEPVIHPPSATPSRGEEPFREHVYGRHNSRSKAGENFSSDGHEKQQLAGHHSMPREVERQPRFLTEKEYRSYGLKSSKHLQPTASAVVDRTLDHNESEQGREQLRRNPGSVISEAALARKETVYREPLFPSEREYRTYGLKGRSVLPASVAPAVEGSTRVMSARPINQGLNNHIEDTYDPYDESTASLVNRYLSLPRTVVTPTESYSFTSQDSFARDPYSAIDIRGHTGRFHSENERAYPPYAPHVPPDYDLRYHHIRDDSRYSPTSVSHRYSFPGPSAPRR